MLVVHPYTRGTTLHWW